jgi:hypothetical protein
VKRRRRRTPWRLAVLQANLWGGPAIPPRSVVQLKDTTDWLGDRTFRIGYYSRMDGLSCVWLVNEKGEYEQTVDQRMILEDFAVLEQSGEMDLYGDDRPKLQAMVSQA